MACYYNRRTNANIGGDCKYDKTLQRHKTNAGLTTNCLSDRYSVTHELKDWT